MLAAIIIIVVVLVILLAISKPSHQITQPSTATTGNLRTKYPNFILALQGFSNLTLICDDNTTLVYRFNQTNQQDKVTGEFLFYLRPMQDTNEHEISVTFKSGSSPTYKSEKRYFKGPQSKDVYAAACTELAFSINMTAATASLKKKKIFS